MKWTEIAVIKRVPTKEVFGLSILRWGDPGQQVSHHLVTYLLPSSGREEDQKDESEREKNLYGSR